MPSRRVSQFHHTPLLPKDAGRGLHSGSLPTGRDSNPLHPYAHAVSLSMGPAKSLEHVAGIGPALTNLEGWRLASRLHMQFSYPFQILIPSYHTAVSRQQKSPSQYPSRGPHRILCVVSGDGMPRPLTGCSGNRCPGFRCPCHVHVHCPLFSVDITKPFLTESESSYTTDGPGVQALFLFLREASHGIH